MEKELTWAEVGTGAIPLICGIILVAVNYGPFSLLGVSVGVGLLATLFVVTLQKIFLRGKQHLAAAQEVRPALGRVSWMALALVLLVAGINKFCMAIYRDGIPILDSEKYQRCLGGAGFNQMDLVTLSFGACLVIFNVFIPKTFADTSHRARKGIASIVEDTWVPALIVVTGVFVLIANLAFAPTVPLHVENNKPLENTRYACNREDGLAKEKIEEERKLKLAASGREAPQTKAAVSGYLLLVALCGLGFFFYGYFQEHRTLLELWSVYRRKRSSSPPSTREALRRKSVRMLVLNLVVLPPMIVGVALARADFGVADVLIYGLFIYSGFGVWNLAAIIVRESTNLFAAIVVLLFQFAYAYLLTALWAAVLIYIKLHLAQQGPFDTALTIALGAILIQVAFGPVFTTVWENTLSDKWLQQSAKYAILAMILSAVVAGAPQGAEKAPITIIFAIVSLLVPRLLMRRNLAAYVLIRVKAGETKKVLQHLSREDITATVLYGEFDLLAKLEIPGAISGWPLRRKRPLDDGKELAELALTINAKIRPVEGVLETQALLDFTRFVEAP
ncbi:hypothetical protein ABH945_003747 [Paraburkholderia sp. GAS333]|uniref:hypothetical protein n=1 Tax=Paraburkholderia sp. GAS333 TaxID=3156279 RepID=UPI003D191C52